MPEIKKKSFSSPDETSSPGEKQQVDVIEVEGIKLQKVTAKPGWQWSKHIKPVVKTENCETHHLIYMISGILASRMEDTETIEFVPGDVADIPPGHDGWTVGDEPAVWLEILRD